MYETPRCFKCGSLEHLKAQCPERRTPAAQAPGAAPADAGGSTDKVRFETGAGGRRRLVMDIPGWAPGPVADTHQWAAAIREADPRLGEAQEARERRLRALAAEQVQEARGSRDGAAATAMQTVWPSAHWSAVVTAVITAALVYLVPNTPPAGP